MSLLEILAIVFILTNTINIILWIYYSNKNVNNWDRAHDLNKLILDINYKNKQLSDKDMELYRWKCALEAERLKIEIEKKELDDLRVAIIKEEMKVNV